MPPDAGDDGDKIAQGDSDDEPRVTSCEERERLRDAFVAAVHQLTEWQNQQTQAVVQHDPDFIRFEALIHMARLAKDNAKYALLAHLSTHGCSRSANKEETNEAVD